MNPEIKILKEKIKNLRVLYVEDEEEMRIGTSLFLNKFFGFVEVAKNGQEGLGQLNQNKFNVIFTDIMMPKMNGLEMLKKADINSDFFCVALTASEIRKNEIEQSVNLYFRKPITYENMSVIMREIVKKFKL